MTYLKKIVYFVVENKITFQLLEDCNYYERKDSVSFACSLKTCSLIFWYYRKKRVFCTMLLFQLEEIYKSRLC